MGCSSSSGARTASPPAGRRRVGLELNPSYASAVGVEITDAEVHAVFIDIQGRVKDSASRAFSSDATPDQILAQVAEVYRQLESRSDGNAPIRGVGVAVPGLVDAERGVALWIPGLLQWHDVEVVRLLEDSLGVPVFLDWRAYTATLAEQWFGAGRGEDNYLYVNVDDGVGMGIVMGGELIRGATSMAGMLAHLRVSDSTDGPVCVCGNVGCLQARIAIPALIHRAQRAVADGVLSVLTTPSRLNDGVLSYTDLVRAAEEGDKLARNLLEDTGETLGLAIADLIHLLNPRLIIVGGQIVRAGNLILEPALRSARRRTLSPMFAATRVVASTLRPGAAILGAGTLVLEHVLELDAEYSGVENGDVLLEHHLEDRREEVPSRRA